jgi:hypothetical protein
MRAMSAHNIAAPAGLKVYQFGFLAMLLRERRFGIFSKISINFRQDARCALTDLYSGHHSTDPRPTFSVPSFEPAIFTSIFKALRLARLEISMVAGRWAITVTFLGICGVILSCAYTPLCNIIGPIRSSWFSSKYPIRREVRRPDQLVVVFSCSAIASCRLDRTLLSIALRNGPFT